MSDPGSDLARFLSADTIAGIGLAVAASTVAALQAQVKGSGVLVSNAAAAILAAAVMPVFESKGYGWGDWMALIMVGTGIAAGGAFLIVAQIGRRLLERTPGLTDSVVDKFTKDKGP